jgi:ParB family chromosome partitioning protein
MGLPQHTSKSVEWYTPGWIIAAATSLMGAIELDPASCATANEVVRARRFFTKEDNGLAKRWYGRIWCNPPYGRGVRNESNQAIWSRAMLAKYRWGEFHTGLLLLKSATSEKWFQELWSCVPACFFRGRVAFVSPEGGKNSPPHGSALFYFGKQLNSFKNVFSCHGKIC